MIKKIYYFDSFKTFDENLELLFMFIAPNDFNTVHISVHLKIKIRVGVVDDVTPARGKNQKMLRYYGGICRFLT